ncbi:MAG: isoprenylcysteine carboxylmethyltransferase family protein [Prolixibacteraceae bacterium]|nr:isoprenylcysteine carboxylmethyltransferase family protein [Prolixibacteraceae bacterium]
MKSSYIIKHVLGTLVFFAVLFVSAGRLDYWQGWVYVAIGLVMVSLNYTVLRIDSQLLSERSKPQDDSKSWDKTILGLSFLLTIAMYVIAGLDSGRFHWSPDFPAGAYATGMVCTIVGQLLFLIAQKQNKFFSSTVRIQTDRGHFVCDSGLYSVVRHPAYLGMIIQSIGFPLLFGSLWTIIPVSLAVILFIIRTALEDATLQKELNGYASYCRKTRYRLVPFVW